MQTTVLELSLLAAFVLGMPVGVSATTLTAPEMNLETMVEAAATTHSMLLQSFGEASDDTLDFFGSFGNDGWGLALNGNYLGMAVNLSYTGMFSEISGIGSFSSTGTIGTSDWVSSGTWSFVPSDTSTWLMGWDSEATITMLGGEKKKPDMHMPDKKTVKRWKDKEGNEYLEDWGTWMLTEDGKDTGQTKPQYSYIKLWKLQDPPRPAPIALAIVGDCLLQGTANFDTGEASGVVAVPEPNTLALLGLVGLALLRRRKERCETRQK